MKPALLIIDLQKAYYRGDTKVSMDKASYYIKSAIPLFRKKGLPIIWVQHIDEDDKAKPGEAGFEIIDALVPEANDYRVRKMYGNSFNKTNLMEILEKEKIDTVLLTGFCAEYCVTSTYRGALDKDLTPILLKNGLASGNQENLKFVETIHDSISFNVLKRILE